MGLYRTLKARFRLNRAQRELARRRVTAMPHGLGAPLLVSLTSYPARFGVLHLTISCLLRQTIRPDGVILWIAEGDMAKLPKAVLELRGEGLEIRATEDLRSFKKIVPLLAERPDAFIATADDDVYYEADWLAGLVQGAQGHPGQVIAHRAHRITYAPDGAMLSYEVWAKNIAEEVAGPDIFATGGLGILYPPGSLHPDTVRADLFRALCPLADDVWLYWMARRQGSVVRHIGGRKRTLEWEGSQHQNLRSVNLGTPGQSGNDRAIAAMTAHFGRP